jgi:acetyl esterase/lipase
MIQKLAATLVAFALSFSALAAEFPMPAPRVTATPRGQEDSYPVQDVTFPNGVEASLGLVYREPPGFRALTLDLYLPPKTVRRPAQGFPLVIFIHGGAFLVGDSRHNPPFADFPGVLASLSARGYVVASVEYRLSGEAVFPAAIRDVKAAIRWLRAHASEYDIDPARAMSWGASAGGNLAGLAAVSCHVPLLSLSRKTTRSPTVCRVP